MNYAPSSQFDEPPSPKKDPDIEVCPLVSMSEAVRVNLQLFLASSTSSSPLLLRYDSLGIATLDPPTDNIRLYNLP